jgi:hypothetical protein
VGYHLTTEMADNAIRYMRDLNAAAPDKPFFLYYVPGGSHSPHQPTKEWIDKFKGKFNMGYEKLHDQIFANQKRLGVIPASTQLSPWPEGQVAYGGPNLPRWDSLLLIQKKLYAREAEVFARYSAYADHEIGRVVRRCRTPPDQSLRSRGLRQGHPIITPELLGILCNCVIKPFRQQRASGWCLSKDGGRLQYLPDGIFKPGFPQRSFR